jgi:hypothetical protein
MGSGERCMRTSQLHPREVSWSFIQEEEGTGTSLFSPFKTPFHLHTAAFLTKHTKIYVYQSC